MAKKGRFEMIVGCMSSGKSEELIRRLNRAVIAKQNVAVFKSMHDTRTDEKTIASRDGKKFHAFSAASSLGILIRVTPEIQVVGIDEAQFFDDDLHSVINQLIDRGIRVIGSGLDTNFRGEPFHPVPELMAIADDVIKLNAVCVQCGAVATRSMLLESVSADVRLDDPSFVGGDEKYGATCRDCHRIL